MSMKAVYLSLLLLVASTRTGLADKGPVYRHRLEALRTRLLSNYSGHFAPFEGARDPFPVHVKFNLIAIRELNSAEQVLSTLAYLVVNWLDPDLSWNPSETGSPGEGVDYIQLTSDDIWTPKIILINRADESQVLHHYDIVSVWNSGYCTGHLPIRLDTTCQVDVTYYPFDTQVCQVIFGSLYSDNLLLSAWVLDVPLHKLFNVSGEWEVMDISINPRNISNPDLTYMFVEFNLALRRRYFFYLFTIIFPMLVLSVTGACGFLLPLECGEKVSFQVAIMVSLAVFLSFVNDSMPKTSSSISRLAIYVDLLLLQSCLSFLATLAVLRGHHLRQRLSHKDKERQDDAKEPETQTIDRQNNGNAPDGTGFMTVKANGRQMLQCLCRTIRRMYCCCCCLPPTRLDTCFFVLYMAGSLVAPFIFLLPTLPWEELASK